MIEELVVAPIGQGNVVADRAVVLLDPRMDYSDLRTRAVRHVDIVVFEILLVALPIRHVVAVGRAGIGQDSFLDLIHVPADFGGAGLVLNKTVKLVGPHNPRGNGDFNHLLGSKSPARDQKIADLRNLPAPVVFILPVGHANSVLHEVGGVKDVLKIELIPFAKHFGKSLGNDALVVALLSGILLLDLHRNEVLHGLDQINVARQRSLQERFSLAKVQIAPTGHARLAKSAVVIRGLPVKHGVHLGAIPSIYVVALFEAVVNLMQRLWVFNPTWGRGAIPPQIADQRIVYGR